jgi:hypothetical protein
MNWRAYNMYDYINSETKDKYSEDEVYKMYDESLDDAYETGVWLMSRLLKDSDPIAYNVGFDDYLDSQNIIEYDSEDEEQEESE